MSNNDKNKNLDTVPGFVGEVRRSKLVSTAGPGAIIDLAVRPGGEAVSGVVAGIEEWNEPEWIEERRLQARHGLKRLGMPPVRQRNDHYTEHTVPFVRFPGWLQCPSCKILRPAKYWSNNKSNLGHAGRYCRSCKNDQGKPLAVVPVRFITACENGHLDDFPWKGWIGCTCDWADVRLTLRQQGAGLAGLMLRCLEKSCPGHGGKSLAGIFGEEGLVRVGLEQCKGRRPWLSTEHAQNEPCGVPRRVLQRGASNVYWPEIDSALDIPPFNRKEIPELDRHAATLKGLPQDVRTAVIKGLGLAVSLDMSMESILEYYSDSFDEEEREEELTFEEYRHFLNLGAPFSRYKSSEFEIESVPIPDEFEPLLETLVQAHRLREVRLLKGFTRIYPPSGAFSDSSVVSAPISRAKTDWLPAIELRGEGLFFALSIDRLREWESRPCVQDRMERLKESVRGDLFDREDFPTNLDARFVLLHSLSHALMTRLTLSCGYSTASLVERVYSHTHSDEHPGRDMAGILIHTGTPDADGTLGGLVEQGETSRFGQILLGALTDSQWCSSDPLCISGTTTLSNARNGSACHSCLLVPETSCSFFNRYLDRAFLVGEPGVPELGFFSHLLDSMESAT